MASYPWENEANNWTEWARRPNHDLFTCFFPAFLEEIFPAEPGVTLEVGCGEGRVARQLVARAPTIVGLDSSRTLARNARELDARATYLAGDATALPFADGSFQTVVAYNSLQAMALEGDMAQTIREVSRVTSAGGHFCICIAHPMTDLDLINERSAASRSERDRSYFSHQRVEETVTQGGLTMTFHGWTYTLEDYLRTLEDAGFLVERMREPQPGAECVSQRPGLARWQQIPLFLFIRAVKPKSSIR